MTKKKGIAVVSGSGDVAFKFLDDGTSVLGKDENSSHAFTGSVIVSGSINVQGSLSMTERLGGYKFGLPYLDGVSDITILNLLDTNSSSYNGFMFYLNATSSAPFDQEKKIYFCEDGVWYPSPFVKEDD
tara:strand:- start:6138 stop:6524 length:387 start_codon:yes stop_codon:yes gene_type:complete